MQASNLILLSQQQALQQAMDITSNNIANSSTTGFKRESISFETFMSRANGGKPINFVVDSGTYRDTASGPIQSTGNQLDLAIQGQGYFQVQGTDGKPRYTRAGSFQTNNQGQLTTQSGLPVLNDGGQPITIPDTVTEINIAADGFITAKTDNGTSLAEIGKIGVVKFQNEQQMQAEGAGLYSSSQAPSVAENSSVIQGALEQSNVEPVSEMSQMIKIYRSYEQTSNMISQDNQRRSDAITKLAKTTA
jgi:flagellar basal-body rod protein FlgF